MQATMENIQANCWMQNMNPCRYGDALTDLSKHWDLHTATQREREREYNNAVVTLGGLYVELILQHEASSSNRIAKAKENLNKGNKSMRDKEREFTLKLTEMMCTGDNELDHIVSTRQMSYMYTRRKIIWISYLGAKTKFWAFTFSTSATARHIATAACVPIWPKGKPLKNNKQQKLSLSNS